LREGCENIPKFAAKLTMLYNEVPFLGRFAAAAKSGVEFSFPYDFDKKAIAVRLAGNGLTQVLTTCRPATGRRRTRHRHPARPRRRIPHSGRRCEPAAFCVIVRHAAG
jgi:hydroxypyruvate isomerase